MDPRDEAQPPAAVDGIDFGFPRNGRITHKSHFERVFRRRASASDAILVLLGHPNDLGRPRLGLSASRKIGGAVVRNRWKRLVREAFRLRQHELPVGIDLVAIPRAVDPPLPLLSASLVALARQVAGRLRRSR